MPVTWNKFMCPTHLSNVSTCRFQKQLKVTVQPETSSLLMDISSEVSVPMEIMFQWRGRELHSACAHVCGVRSWQGLWRKIRQAKRIKWLWGHIVDSIYLHYFIFSSVHLLSCVWLFATPWIAAYQASLSITNSRSSLKLTSIESVMPSSHLILGRPLLLLPPILPSIRVFQWVNSSHEVAKVVEFQL